MTAFSAAAGSSVATIQISYVRAWVAAGSADTRMKIAPAMLLSLLVIPVTPISKNDRPLARIPPGEDREFAAAIIVEPLDAPHAWVLAILKNPSRPRHTWLTRALPASSAAREPPLFALAHCANEPRSRPDFGIG